jgi:hypothetical protein
MEYIETVMAVPHPVAIQVIEFNLIAGPSASKYSRTGGNPRYRSQSQWCCRLMLR